MEAIKLCQRCGNFKPESRFAPRFDKDYEGSRRNTCRDCANARHREREMINSGKTCLRCRQKQPLDEFPFRHDAVAQKTGQAVRRGVCRACTRARQSELNKGGERLREVKRKLPAYEVLKDLVLVKGMSYQQIADKYGVHKRAVYGTLKRRAELRGEWPLLSEADSKRRAKRANYVRWKVGNGNAVDSRFVADALREYLETVEQPRIFVAGKHVVFPPGDFRQWAVLNGLRPEYIRRVLAGLNQTMTAAYAKRIYDLIGEEVPDWLAKAAERGMKPDRLPPHEERARLAALAAAEPERMDERLAA